jgi:hypothetical protein
MTKYGVGTESEDRCHPPSLERDRSMPEGIDARMNAVESPTS